jgi:hypothetical protein
MIGPAAREGALGTAFDHQHLSLGEEGCTSTWIIPQPQRLVWTVLMAQNVPPFWPPGL